MIRDNQSNRRKTGRTMTSFYVCKYCSASLIPFHSFTLFTHIPFPLLYAFSAYLFSPHLRILRILLHNFFNINTEELSRDVAKVVPVNEITDSKLPFFQNRKIRV